MKKQTALFLSFSALLAIGALAPKIQWNAGLANRFPASVEDVKGEIQAQSVAAVVINEEIACLKDKQPKELEAEVKKLMDDKEAILNELAELKKSKKDETKIENKDDKKVLAKNENESILDIMSQLTALMMSQQQQQTIMMNQMFSMFQVQQPKEQSWYSPLSEYMSPYAFNAGQFRFPEFERTDSLLGMGHNIGLGYDMHSMHRGNTAYDLQRAPAEQFQAPVTNFDFGMTRSPLESNSFQPGLQLQQRPHQGFDFNKLNDGSDLERQNF